MSLARYAVKRLFTGILTILLIITVNFFLFRLPALVMGVDPALIYGIQRVEREAARQGLTKQQIEELIAKLRREWNTPAPDAPITEWIEAFFRYMYKMFIWDFGVSFFAPREPVIELLATRLPYTLLLLGLYTLFSMVIGINLGIYTVKSYGKSKERTLTIFSFILYNLPAFWVEIMFLWFFAVVIRVYPATAGTATYIYKDPLFRLMDLLYLFSVPILALVLVGFGHWFFLTRNSLIYTLGQDYIMTARAKGLDERTILYKHAFRNAILPVFTSIVLALASIWTGAVLTETIFNIPGVGLLLLESVLSQNYPLAEMIFYFIALTTVFANVIADISYALLDPRVRYETKR